MFPPHVDSECALRKRSARAHLTRGLLAESCLSTSASRLALAILFAAGALSAALPASAANFNVANESQLSSAITNAQNGDTITFTAQIVLTANLPAVQRNVTINGGNFSLSGGGHPGLIVSSGTVAINNLFIFNFITPGGNGGKGFGNSSGAGGGGGGGAGLGGALFVGSGATVTVSNVKLQSNSARGGNGSGVFPGASFTTSGGGGGRFGNGEDGGVFVDGKGGAGGGGDGGGSPGGFGGGGGGAASTVAGAGGFGGGGGGRHAGGPGGPGGFGGGNGGSDGSAGGGAGLGGAIFVQQGGNLILAGPLDVAGNTVAGGISGEGTAQPGKAFGSGIFLQGSGSLAVAPSFAQTQTIDAIVDQTGSGGTGANAGSWSLVKTGSAGGTTILRGENAYSGGTTISSGTLQIGSGGTTGSIVGNVTNNAFLDFNRSDTITYSGVVSGTGSLTQRGPGTLVLTGNNTYSGATTIFGRLIVQNSTALGTTAGVVTVRFGAALELQDIIGGIGVDVGSNPLILSGTGVSGGGALRNLKGINSLNSYGGAITLDGATRINSDAGTLKLSGNIGNIGAAGQNLTVGGAGNTTISGIIGVGTLTKDGTGTLVLSGANTYAGGTTVTGGLVRFTSDANLGAAGTGITLNAGSIGTTGDTQAASSSGRSIALAGDGRIDVALHPFTWSGNISGSGQLIKSGPGELELTGTNTYSGGTLIQFGTLRVASDDKLGAAGTGLTLNNNGSLRASSSFTSARAVSMTGAGGVFQVDDGQTLTLNGVVSGSNLTKIDRGTLVLGGANTYTGNTVVNGGTVQGSTAGIRGNIAFDTNTGNTFARSVTFDQATDGTFAGTITGIGSLTKTGAGTLTLSPDDGGSNTYTAGTTVSAGTLQGDSRSLQGAITNNAAVIFDQGFDGTYAGAMTGTGTLTKNGPGRLNLTGTSSVRGGTTLNAGNLAVNGSLTSNVVVNGGILSGVGKIDGTVTINAGEMAPGNSIGNFTINGNLTVNRGVWEIEINNNGASDRVTVNGSATLNGGTVEVVAAPGAYVPNTVYTIVATSGGVVGKFDNLTSDLAFLTPTLSYDPYNVYLSLLLGPNAFRSVGQTVNQQAVGGALDAIAASGNVGGLVTALANLSSGQGAPALQALSGQPYADFGTLDVRGSQLFMSAVGRQMAANRGANPGADKSVALAEACDVACDGEAPRRFGAWISAIGSTGSVLGDNNAAGLTYTFGGTAFGIDYRLDPSLLIGLAGGWVSGTQWVNGFTGNGYADVFNVALYASFNQGAFYADALAGYANASNRLQRVINTPGLPTGITNGSASANQFIGQIETGYRIGLDFPGRTSVSPFARLQVGASNQAGFTESGTSLYNLTVASQTTTSVRSTLGVDLAAGFDLGGGTPLNLGLRLGWMHEYADTGRPMTAAFAAAPGGQFTVFGATPQRDSAVLGVSAVAAINERTSAFLAYDGEVGGGTDNHALRVGLRLTW